MSQDDLSSVVEFTNQVLRSSRLELTATGESGEEGPRVLVSGDDVPLLLGHNAELLDALEYLGNRILARTSGEDGRIVFDSGNYRARREKELRLMAEKAAEKVRSTRLPFSFDPMTANERRIIHLTLSQDATVRTESRGDGENRKLIIYPA
jgi:spoIIIJ-associated protein